MNRIKQSIILSVGLVFLLGLGQAESQPKAAFPGEGQPTESSGGSSSTPGSVPFPGEGQSTESSGGSSSTPGSVPFPGEGQEPAPYPSPKQCPVGTKVAGYFLSSAEEVSKQYQSFYMDCKAAGGIMSQPDDQSLNCCKCKNGAQIQSTEGGCQEPSNQAPDSEPTPDPGHAEPIPGSNWTADFNTFPVAAAAAKILNKLLEHRDMTPEYAALIDSILYNGREFRMAGDTPVTNPYTNVTTFPVFDRNIIASLFAHELGHDVNPLLLDFAFAPDKEIFSHKWFVMRPDGLADFYRTTWDPYAEPSNFSVSQEYNAVHFENQIGWMMEYANVPDGYRETSKGIKHHYTDEGSNRNGEDYSVLKSDAQEFFRTHPYLDPSVPAR